MSEEDKKSLKDLEDKGMKINQKEDVENHLSHLNYMQEIFHTNLSNDFSERKSINNIGFQIIRERDRENYIQNQKTQ